MAYYWNPTENSRLRQNELTHDSAYAQLLKQFHELSPDAAASESRSPAWDAYKTFHIRINDSVVAFENGDIAITSHLVGNRECWDREQSIYRQLGFDATWTRTDSYKFFHPAGVDVAALTYLMDAWRTGRPIRPDDRLTYGALKPIPRAQLVRQGLPAIGIMINLSTGVTVGCSNPPASWSRERSKVGAIKALVGMNGPEETTLTRLHGRPGHLLRAFAYMHHGSLMPVGGPITVQPPQPAEQKQKRFKALKPLVLRVSAELALLHGTAEGRMATNAWTAANHTGEILVGLDDMIRSGVLEDKSYVEKLGHTIMDEISNAYSNIEGFGRWDNVPRAGLRWVLSSKEAASSTACMRATETLPHIVSLPVELCQRLEQGD